MYLIRSIGPHKYTVHSIYVHDPRSIEKITHSRMVLCVEWNYPTKATMSIFRHQLMLLFHRKAQLITCEFVMEKWKKYRTLLVHGR